MSIIKKLQIAGVSDSLAAAIMGDIADGLVSTGSTQSSAYRINADVSRFVVVPIETGAILPVSSVKLDKIEVINAGNNALMLYPSVDERIGTSPLNSPISVAAGSAITLRKVSDGGWAVVSNYIVSSSLASIASIAVINEIYVSTAGNDVNSGSVSSPFLTINKALNHIRGATNGGAWRINVGAGTYSEEVVCSEYVGSYRDSTYGDSVVFITGASAATTIISCPTSFGTTVRLGYVDAVYVLDKLTITSSTTNVVGLRVINSNVYLLDVDFSNLSTAINASSNSSCFWSAGTANSISNCTSCFSVSNSSRLTVSKNLTATFSGSFAQSLNSSFFNITTGVQLNLSASSGTANSAFSVLVGGNIVLGANSVINCTSIKDVVVGNNNGLIRSIGNVSFNLTDCTNGLGTLNGSSIFEETGALNTYTTSGTTPAQYVTNDAAIIASQNAIFATGGWIRKHRNISDSAALLENRSPLVGSNNWTLGAGATLDTTAETLSMTVGNTATFAHNRRAVGSEIICKIAYSGTTTDPAHIWADIGMNDASRHGFHAQLRGDGQLTVWRLPGWVGFGTVSASTSGTWVRLSLSSLTSVEAWYSTSTNRPASESQWAFVGRIDLSADATALAGALAGTITSNLLTDTAATGTAVYSDLSVRGVSV